MSLADPVPAVQQAPPEPAPGPSTSRRDAFRQVLNNFRWPPSKRLLVRLGIAVALVVAAALTNRSYLGWGLFVCFAVLLVPIGRARSFVFSFVPYAAVWFVFTALRSLADETILAQTLNMKVADFERWLFGGELPTIELQHQYFDPDNLRWWDYALTGVHWSYFFVPHLVAVRAWQKSPALFRHHLWAMTMLLTVGLFIYFLIPSNPPWLAGEAVDSPAAPTVIRIMEPVGKQLGGGPAFAKALAEAEIARACG